MNEAVEQPTPMQALAMHNQSTANEEWKPSRREYLREYEVTITFLTLGCIIRVGCKTIPFTTVKEGMEALNEYVAKPYETRQVWEKRFQEEE